MENKFGEFYSGNGKKEDGPETVPLDIYFNAAVMIAIE